MKDYRMIAEKMTLQEKASLCSLENYWYTSKVPNQEIPEVLLTDGPHGIRKQQGETDSLGLSESVDAVCFPSGTALACSFDEKLLELCGRTLGEEACAEGIQTLLGPAINIKRSPLCGRNFEYFSEDPYLAGKLAAGYIRGMQGQGVSVCIKHFAANNQECQRMRVDARVDERTLREIYLQAFEIAVKESKPWSIMCSYNRINGVYSCENEWLLTNVLRKEWGFDGVVITDWGAMNDRCKALVAGLDIEAPSSGGERDKQIIKAVQDGSVSEEVLDRAVIRILKWLDRQQANAKICSYNKENHHKIAKKIASECAVLLKNNGILPLSQDATVAFIGEFAEKPRFQGSGSSYVKASKVTNALHSIEQLGEVVYNKGFLVDSTEIDKDLFADAVQTAKNCKCAVIFAGLPDSFESEGFDRTSIDLPKCQNELIQAVCSVQPNTIVVLHNGSPVAMSWVDQVAAILEMNLGGQAVGEATVELLYGVTCPGGKLAESYPLRIQDTPCFIDFPGDGLTANYSEGVFVGYRYYDRKDIDVLFEFGYGLSYTTFELSDMELSSDCISDSDELFVTVEIKNTGERAGSEVVQLYVAPPKGDPIVRPLKELKAFEKVYLRPKEKKKITFTLSKRSFSFYDTELGNWHVPTGAYTINLGFSSRKIILKKEVTVRSTATPVFTIHEYTTVGDAFKYSKNANIMFPYLKLCGFDLQQSGNKENKMGEGTDLMVSSMIDGMPLHSLLSFGLKQHQLDEMCLGLLSI